MAIYGMGLKVEKTLVRFQGGLIRVPCYNLEGLKISVLIADRWCQNARKIADFRDFLNLLNT